MENPFETEERRAFRETVRRFVAEEITPHVDDWDEQGSVPHELHIKAGALGAFGFGTEEKWGGLGFDDCFMRAAWWRPWMICWSRPSPAAAATG